jgi:hypothetical protein
MKEGSCSGDFSSTKQSFPSFREFLEAENSGEPLQFLHNLSVDHNFCDIIDIHSTFVYVSDYSKVSMEDFKKCFHNII